MDGFERLGMRAGLGCQIEPVPSEAGEQVTAGSTDGVSSDGRDLMESTPKDPVPVGKPSARAGMDEAFGLQAKGPARATR